MGRQGRVGDQFRRRLKSERERRDWSQADMANLLSEKGIAVHPTTIAKIEAGDRAVRVDELNAIADLFGTSVDALLGRSPAGSDLVWFASRLLSLARNTAESVGNVSESIADELQEVRYYAEFDADGPEAEKVDGLCRATETALSALSEARHALSALGDMPTPGVTVTTRTVEDYERQMDEMAKPPNGGQE